MSDDLMAYLEVRSRKYLESWPKVPAVFATSAERLKEAGVVKDFSGDTSGNDHSSTLTPIGGALLYYVISSTLSLMTPAMILDLWPLSKLMNRSIQATNFLKLFKLDWNDQSVRVYLSDRTAEIIYTGLEPEDHGSFSKAPVSAYPVLAPFLVQAMDEPDFAPDAACGYCEGTGRDPFEDRACPSCAPPAARYFYHPESNCLFVESDPNYQPGDPLVEEIDEATAHKIKAVLDEPSILDDIPFVKVDGSSYTFNSTPTEDDWDIL